jgi:hypothetical protein
MRRGNTWRALAVIMLAAATGCGAVGDRADTADVRTCRSSMHTQQLELAAARDTLAALRGRAQRVAWLRETADGVEVRTEDADSLSFHDGGVVTFDCRAHISLVWLDGG